MRDAMASAAKAGAVTGANIKKALRGDAGPRAERARRGVPAVHLTANDHRGTTTVMLYRNEYNVGSVTAQRVYQTTIPLRPDWLGW